MKRKGELARVNLEGTQEPHSVGLGGLVKEFGLFPNNQKICLKLEKSRYSCISKNGLAAVHLEIRNHSVF